MQKKQKNRFSMYHSVISYMDENSSKVNINEELAAHLTAFKNLDALIAVREDASDKATRGKVKAKKITRRSVTVQATAVAAALNAYARKINDVPMTESTDLPKWRFDRLRDTNFAIVLNSIKDLAESNAEALVKFGISSDKLAAFIANIRVYEKALSAKAVGTSVKTETLGSMRSLFKEADNTLVSLDKIMETYNTDDADFLTGYRAARVVKNLGARQTVRETSPPETAASTSPPASQ